MGKFEGKLILEYLDKPVNGKWFEVVNSFNYTTNANLTITVPFGTKTDFASIPRVFRALIPRVGKYGKAAVLHDWLCEYKIFARKKTDRIFLEAMKTLDVGWLKRRLMYIGVRSYSVITFKK